MTATFDESPRATEAALWVTSGGAGGLDPPQAARAGLLKLRFANRTHLDYRPALMGCTMLEDAQAWPLVA
jgi:hypothetical protein